MKQIAVPATESPFDYYCPICGIELARSNFETDASGSGVFTKN